MIISSIYQGLLYGILGLGIYMTFRILDFPDLTTEGSFPLGGAVAVTLMNFGWNPILATLVAVIAGCLAGLVTGLLYTKGEIPTILAGILVMTSLNSVMLMIMGRANLGLLDIKTIQDLFPFSKDYNLLIVGLLAVTIVITSLIAILYQFLLTAVIAFGFNTNYLKLFSAIVLALCLISPVLRRKFYKGVSLSR